MANIHSKSFNQYIVDAVLFTTVVPPESEAEVLVDIKLVNERCCYGIPAIFGNRADSIAIKWREHEREHSWCTNISARNSIR